MAYYPLTESAGTTAYDWAHGHNGTLQGGVTLGQSSAPGLPGTAVHSLPMRN